MAPQLNDKLLNSTKKAIKTDNKIDKNVEKKIEQVAHLITNHILKGNDLKLLSLPENIDGNDEKELAKEELRSISSEIETGNENDTCKGNEGITRKLYRTRRARIIPAHNTRL